MNAGNERLSYLQSDEFSHYHMYSQTLNPCKSLTEAFSTCEDEIETEHLKVYLRIRPLLSEETVLSREGSIEVLNTKSILLKTASGMQGFRIKPQGISTISHKFVFTRVYNEEINQKVLFEETSENLVKDLVAGQNCLLFTYGATNSGKTHTIQGSYLDPGLLPRTLNLIFSLVGMQQYKGSDLRPAHFCSVVRMSEQEIRKEIEFKEEILKVEKGVTSFSSSLSLHSCISQDTECSSLRNVDDSVSTYVSDTIESSIADDSLANTTYAIFVSFAEIYNEYIYDLLDKTTLSRKERQSPLSLGEDRNGAIYIKGLKEVRVVNAEEALQVLEVGKHHLHFGATKLNHQSSRSHCIFTLKLIHLADPDHPHIARVSILSLCDLAGAERAGKIPNSMDRLKEANNINTSLLVLGRCMAALRQNQIIAKQGSGTKKPLPVPYRDSKVTRIFQSFFIGRGQVAMIVNISTSSLLFDETLKVLKFSALASKITVTRERPSVGPIIMDKSSSQFSQLVRQSLNMSTVSGRLSVPWENKSYNDVTFGAVRESDSSQMMPVPETDEDEENERLNSLLQLISKLKERLLKETREKMELEDKLRKEITDAFSKRIVQIEDTWKNRMDEEHARAEEFMEWRMNLLMNSTKKSHPGMRKRQRQEDDSDDDDDGDEEKVPTIYFVREEIKVQALEDEKMQLKEELEALKTSLKAVNQTAKGAQEENSKLVFQLADMTKSHDHILKEKDDMKTILKQYEEHHLIDGNNYVIKDLQKKIISLQKSEERRDLEIENLKGMLVEAAEEYHEKEELVHSMTMQIQSLNNLNTGQAVTIAECESQLSVMKDMLASHGMRLEEREFEIRQLQHEQQILLEKEKKERIKAEEVHAVKELLISQLQEEKEALERWRAESTNLSSEQHTGKKIDSEQRIYEVFEENETFEKVVNQMNRELKIPENEKATSGISLKSQKWHLQSPDLETLKNLNRKLEEEKQLYADRLLKAENKIDECYKDKEATNSRLKMLIDKHGAMESHIQSLIEERNQLEGTLSAEAGHTKNSLFKKIDRLTNALKEKEEEIKRLTSSLKGKEENIVLLTSTVKEKEEKIDGLIKTLEEKEEEIDQLTSSLKEQKEEIDQLTYILKEKKDEIDHLTSSLKEKKDEIDQLISSLKEQKDEIDQLTSSLKEQKEEIDQLTYILKEKKEEIDHLTSSLKEKEGEIDGLISILGGKGIEIDRLTSIIEGKDEEISNLSADTLKAKLQINSLEEIVIQRDITIERLLADVDELREKSEKDEETKKYSELMTQKLAEKDEELREMANKLERVMIDSGILQEKLMEVEKEKDAKESIIEDLNERVNRERERADESDAIRKLLQLEQKMQEAAVVELKSQLQRLQQEEDTLVIKLKGEVGAQEESAKKLHSVLKDYEARNSNLEKELCIAREEMEKYQKQLQQLIEVESENSRVKELLEISCKKEKELEELQLKSQTKILSLNSLVEEKGGTLRNMVAKIERLDKSLSVAEDELLPYKTRCEVLEKEVAALREARLQELEKKEMALILKDEEILSLQREIKSLLHISKSDASKDQELTLLREKLRESETESDALKVQLQNRHEQPSTNSPIKNTHRKSRRKKIDFVEGEGENQKTPTSTKSNRRVRNNKPLISIENATPDNSLRLHLDPLESDDSVKKPQTQKTRSGRVVKSKTCVVENTEDDGAAYFKVPSSQRKNSRASSKDDNDSAWEPELPDNRTRSARNSRIRSKTNSSKVFNPHLENKENKSCDQASSDIPEEGAEKPSRSRGRRKRTLYSAVEGPFECAPNLIELHTNEDSPHTTVRRLLRSQNKAK